MTYLTPLEEHGFAFHLKNASGCGPCGAEVLSGL